MAKIKLMEQYSIQKERDNIEIIYKNILIEDKNNKSVNCRGIIKNIPVTKYTENDNSRIYGKDLWEKVKKDNVFEGSICCANHDENGDGDVTKISGIWKNFNILNEFAVADLYCVGSLGELMMEILDSSGKVGFSSVGYGEFKEDSKTVDPESYEYRQCDWVLDPSQGTFATKNNLVQENNEQIEKNIDISEEIVEKTEESIEKIDKKDDILENKNTNKLTGIIDNNKEVKQMEKLHEANFKNQVNAIIVEAKKNPNLLEAIGTLERIDVAGDVQLIEKVNSAVESLQIKLAEEKVNAEEKIVSMQSELDELQEKYDASCKVAEDLKENYKKAKSIIEKVGVKEEDEEGSIVNLLEKDKKSGERIKKLIETKQKMLADIKQLVEDRKNMRSDTKQLLEDRKNMFADLKQLVEDRKNMMSDIKALVEKYNTLRKKYTTLLKKFKEEDEDVDAEDEAYTFSSDVDDSVPSEEEVIEEEDEVADEVDIESDEVDIESDLEEDDEFEDEEIVADEEIMSDDDEEMIEDDEYEDEIVADEEVIEDEEIIEEENEDEITGEVEVTGDEIIDDEILGEDDDYESEEVMIDDEEEMIEDDEYEDEEIAIDDDEEEVVMESIKRKKGIKKQKSSNIIRTEIQKLYVSEAKKYPALKNIKKLVLSSKSIVEAVNKIDKFKESRKARNKLIKKESNMSTERRPDFLEGRL